MDGRYHCILPFRLLSCRFAQIVRMPKGGRRRRTAIGNDRHQVTSNLCYNHFTPHDSICHHRSPEIMTIIKNSAMIAYYSYWLNWQIFSRNSFSTYLLESMQHEIVLSHTHRGNEKGGRKSANRRSCRCCHCCRCYRHCAWQTHAL